MFPPMLFACLGTEPSCRWKKGCGSGPLLPLRVAVLAYDEVFFVMSKEGKNPIDNKH